MYSIQLSGTKVTLREFQPNDLDRVLTVVGDHRVTESPSFDTRSHEQVEELLSGILDHARKAPRTEYYLAVTAAGRWAASRRSETAGQFMTWNSCIPECARDDEVMSRSIRSSPHVASARPVRFPSRARWWVPAGDDHCCR